MNGLAAAAPRTVLVLDAGHHPDSRTSVIARRAATACRGAFATAAGHAASSRVQTWPVRHDAHELLDDLLRGSATEAGQRWRTAAARAAGIVLVTPCHNGSLSVLAKLALDVLPPRTLLGTPAIVTVVGASHRHTLVGDLVVRPVLAGLGAHPVPTAVYAADEDWIHPTPASPPQPGGALVRRLETAAAELALAVTRAGAPSSATPAGSPREKVGPLAG